MFGDALGKVDGFTMDADPALWSVSRANKMSGTYRTFLETAGRPDSRERPAAAGTACMFGPASLQCPSRVSRA
jgi:hypothetical protein